MMILPMKQYCEKCGKEVEYTIGEELLKGRLRGDVYQYKGERARCEECKSVVFDAGVQDRNLDRLYAEYCRKNDIVATSKINDILTKYCICSDDISMLLGWGEKTVSSLCEGDVPSKDCSDMLKHIYDDPNFYLECLRAGKERISEFSFKRSELAALSLLSNAHTDESDSDMALVN